MGSEFKIYKNAIPAQIIDDVLGCHELFKHNSKSVFRAQGSTNFELPLLDEYGNQRNSIQNPHLLGLSNGFDKKIEQIIFHNVVSECLKDFTGEADFVHWQSMFFDKSTGTKPHQDTWYLDTKPGGDLIGVWFALENIEADNGPFFLYENGPKNAVDSNKYDFDGEHFHDEFISDYEQSRKVNFYAEKGDILLWNSFVMHGSDLPLRANVTRKSITSHYYPKGMAVKEPPVKRVYSIYNHSQPRSTSNPNITKAAVIDPMLYSAICIALRRLGSFRSFITNDHTAHKKLSKIRRID